MTDRYLRTLGTCRVCGVGLVVRAEGKPSLDQLAIEYRCNVCPTHYWLSLEEALELELRERQ